MMNFGLIKLLADGAFHSGDELGAELGVSRAAVWKAVRYLRNSGFDVHAVRGKGYRLPGGLELLDREVILRACGPEVGRRVSLVTLGVVDSTNTYCLEQLRRGKLSFQHSRVAACVAEQQTAGRGRRGRVWVSPFGRNLYLSIVREFSGGASSLEGLSLVVGLGVVRALEECGVGGLSLKWPNDVLVGWRKLAGILLEMSGDVAGSCQVVVGVGVNLDFGADRHQMSSVDQPWVDLASCGSILPPRNHLAGVLIRQLVTLLDEFELKGFSAFRRDWEALHSCQGLEVRVGNPARTVTGVVLGVTDEGGLRVSVPGGVEVFNGGEVSVETPARRKI